MNVTLKTGSIFDSNCRVLVNPVNCVGAMGSGLAKEFKQRYGADYFRAYKEDCASLRLRIGQVTMFKPTVVHDRVIMNFPTKAHWRHSTRVEWIRMGLRSARRELNVRFRWPTVAFPLLGAGLGGLDPDNVRQLLFDELLTWQGEYEIWEPQP